MAFQVPASNSSMKTTYAITAPPGKRAIMRWTVFGSLVIGAQIPA